VYVGMSGMSWGVFLGDGGCMLLKTWNPYNSYHSYHPYPCRYEFPNPFIMCIFYLTLTTHTTILRTRARAKESGDAPPGSPDEPPKMGRAIVNRCRYPKIATGLRKTDSYPKIAGVL